MNVQQISDEYEMSDEPALAGKRYWRRVVVKFYDYVELPYEDGVETYIQEHQIAPWDRLVAEFPGITLKRLYTSLTPAQIQELVAQAVQTDPTYRSPNFLTYFVIEMPPELDPEALAKAISEWEVVELAYAESPVAPAPCTPMGTNPRRLNQGYLGPNGINVEAVWSLNRPGGCGNGIRLVDMEKGWIFNHEDLLDAANNPKVQLTPGVGGFSLFEKEHGTAVLGIMLATDNGLGCIGIAHQAIAQVISIYRTATTPADRPDAILGGISALGFGDVFLLEAQIYNGTALAPLELETANFDMIRLATALGIVVVEAAGNGGVDLGTRQNNAGKYILNTTHADRQDSGAILVGAASRKTPHIRWTSSTVGGSDCLVKPIEFSNYGNRVDCYAWGECVNTTGWTSLATNAYTSFFGGTSSAAAIIAGAALVVQGLAVNNPPSRRFGARQLRQILKAPANGTPSANPAVDQIGVMPDLGKIVGKNGTNNALNLAPDIYLRDFVGDTGNPHTGSISSSPDIILRKTAVPNPQAAFGPGSGTENSNTLGSEAEQGQNNFVYVRVKNRGGTAVTNVKAIVYWAPVATLITPSSWNMVGSVTIPNVPTGNVLTVSDAITWSTVPATGHYCFVGILCHPQDPAPQLTNLLDFNNFYDFIRRNNNVTWRNFNVVNKVLGMGLIFLPFLATGAPEEEIEMRLEVEAMLPEGAQIWLEGPLYFMEMLLEHTRYLETEDEQQKGRYLLNPHGVTGFETIPFPAGLEAEMVLLVDIPEDQWEYAYEVFVRQLYQETEVGRITWYLTPHLPEEYKLTKKRNKQRTSPIHDEGR